MKHIYLNLKRFDIPPHLGGINRIAPIMQWGRYIVENTQDALKSYGPEKAEFVMFLPETHLLCAVSARTSDSPVCIGSQSVHWGDTSPGGNFGAFTSSRTANSMSAIGCTHTIIGHCEERKKLGEIFAEAGSADKIAVNNILNSKITAALKGGLKVLYCIGETEQEHDDWQGALRTQLDLGLDGINTDNVVIAYEPVWSIGPGKTSAGKDHITAAARFIKETADGMDVVYGGGLKSDNAEMLASIEEIDGGLIALTRFTGDIGFYPEEYLEIIEMYLNSTETEAQNEESV